MPGINHKKICEELLSLLSPKQREVIERRFGLKTGKRETLEAIGKSHRICRERVRQVEKAAMAKMKKKIAGYREIGQVFARYLRDCGGVCEEETLLIRLGGEEFKSHVNFLLILGNEFIRFGGNENFKSFWALDDQSAQNAKNFISAVAQDLEQKRELASIRQLALRFGVKKTVAESYLGISARVQKNKDGLYGLREWPEVNPKGIKDKIYLLFKKNQNPLHFTDVARQIEGSLVQTVHNELIRDQRFVLVGRGLYALKEWGYLEGDVKAVLINILENEKRPLTRREIVERALKQRHIKENTVLMNLGNKKYFSRDQQGRYTHIVQNDSPLSSGNVQES